MYQPEVFYVSKPRRDNFRSMYTPIDEKRNGRLSTVERFTKVKSINTRIELFNDKL